MTDPVLACSMGVIAGLRGVVVGVSVGAVGGAGYPPAVVPVLVGPLQALLAILPGILIALGGLIITLFRWSTVKKVLRFFLNKSPRPGS